MGSVLRVSILIAHGLVHLAAALLDWPVTLS